MDGVVGVAEALGDDLVGVEDLSSLRLAGKLVAGFGDALSVDGLKVADVAFTDEFVDFFSWSVVALESFNGHLSVWKEPINEVTKSFQSFWECKAEV